MKFNSEEVTDAVNSWISSFQPNKNHSFMMVYSHCLSVGRSALVLEATLIIELFLIHLIDLIHCDLIHCFYSAKNILNSPRMYDTTVQTYEYILYCIAVY